MELYKKKSIDKIRINEICEKAMISKGTFYLHYLDIYDLYDQLMENMFEDTFNDIHFDLFFDNPDSLFDEIENSIFSHQETFNALTKGKTKDMLLKHTTEVFIDRIYQTDRIEKNNENDLKLNILIGSMFTIFPMDTSKNHDISKELIKNLIKEYVN